MSRWAPGKKTPKSVGRAYVGFWFHCSPNPKTDEVLGKEPTTGEKIEDAASKAADAIEEAGDEAKDAIDGQ